MLDGCRVDLDAVRQNVGSDGDGGAADYGRVEQRLSRVADRLERAAGALAQMLEQAAQAAAIPAAAEVLAREADHRIKNSLQTVVSLLHRQAAQAQEDAVRDALYVAGARVTAVAQVHATLHDRTTPYGIVPEFDLKTYLGDLCSALGRAMGFDGEHRILVVDLASWAISPAVAQAIGLAVSELVTNALRHAFWPERSGTVHVTGTIGKHGDYQICIEDNGRGLPRDFDLRHRPSSGLGLRLVNMLVDQARARLIVYSEGGTRFILTLPGLMHDESAGPVRVAETAQSSPYSA